MATLAPALPDITCLADRMLRAWLCADPDELQKEFDSSSRISCPARDEGEAERLELLQTVAARMRSCPTLLAARSDDPGLDLCVGLLAHLAGMRNHRG